jgi:hypothetical protein
MIDRVSSLHDVDSDMIEEAMDTIDCDFIAPIYVVWSCSRAFGDRNNPARDPIVGL